MKIKKVICFSFSKFMVSTAAPNSKKYVLNAMPDENTDLVFIRHGESTFNVACEDYRKKHNIPYVWKELCNHEGFDQKVLFNPRFIDCPLTELGKSQCKKTQRLLERFDIDCVLVSPQLRALQTCNEIFRNHTLPVYVEPLLVGPLRSCSDVNRSTKAKKKMFPEYNFRPTQKCQELWYLNYLNEQQRNICLERFKEKKIETLEQKRVELVKLLKEGKIYENAFDYRQRIQTLKFRMAEYKQKYRRIAVVSHYYTIEYLGAIDYEESGAPKYYIDIKNCRPYYSSILDLLSYKEAEKEATLQ